MTAGLNIEDIRAALTVADVLPWAGIEVSERGRGDLFGHQCPREYHRQSPRAFTINRETGLWTCYACAPSDGKQLSGDLLRLIAEHQRLSTVGEDFSRVLTIAAGIAGVTSAPVSAEERARRIRERAALQAEARSRQVSDDRRWRSLSIDHATAYWQALATRHDPAEQWLAERGVIQALDLGLVRFDLADHGSVAMPLYTADGQIANVIRRRLPQHAPTKNDRFRPLSMRDGDAYRGLWGRGTYVNPISDIEPDRAVVLVEGFFDAITSALAFRATPARTVGARSASDLATIARAALPRIKSRLLLAPHRDDAGFDGALAACREALAAGLRLGNNTLAIVDCGANDLNEAWCTGWRP